MKTVEEVKEYLMDHGWEETIVFENPDYASAFIGVSTDGRAVYNFDLMIGALMDEDGMEYDEAIEFIEYHDKGTALYRRSSARCCVYGDRRIKGDHYGLLFIHSDCTRDGR